MAGERRFLIASSFARLIQQENDPVSRIVEGHFPAQADRIQLVRVEQERAALILVRQGENGGATEDQAEIPHTHAVALIDIAAGTVAFDRIEVELLGEGRALLDRFILPRGLDVLTTVAEEGRGSDLPEWFGPEVTGRPEYNASSLAINGVGIQGEISISDSALQALLDLLEGRSSSRLSELQVFQQAETSPEQTGSPQRAEATVLVQEEDLEQNKARDIQPLSARQPRLRTNVLELDEGLAQIARSLAPRGSEAVR